jgi:hypothetical protein
VVGHIGVPEECLGRLQGTFDAIGPLARTVLLKSKFAAVQTEERTFVEEDGKGMSVELTSRQKTEGDTRAGETLVLREDALTLTGGMAPRTIALRGDPTLRRWARQWYQAEPPPRPPVARRAQ